jgi:aspartate aminotransferase-like enzyme
VLEGLKQVFKTTGSVVIYPSSGTGAWEAALVNTLSPGDRVLMFETGLFATMWRNLAARLGLENVFARHDRLVEATRRAVRAWNLEVLCLNPQEYSSSVTAVLMPGGHDADAFRKLVLGKFNMSLGNGLGKLQGKVFRIGHLGDFNDLMLAGTLSGLEMGFALAGVPFSKGGVLAALDYLAGK